MDIHRCRWQSRLMPETFFEDVGTGCGEALALSPHGAIPVLFLSQSQDSCCSSFREQDCFLSARPHKILGFNLRGEIGCNSSSRFP